MRALSCLTVLCVLVLSGCSTPGAFFGATQGHVFREHVLSDEDHALVYLYRPQSDWADQELEAPALFLNNERIGSLPSNAYMVLEFDIASYQLEMRRPLFGSHWTLFADGPLDFTLISSFALDAEAGGIYYLRYDELNPPPVNEQSPSQGDGPLQLVSKAVADTEIGATHEIQPFERIAASGETERMQRSFWRQVGKSLDKIGI
ncbi:DUF2846 domain-containing protein [Pseudomonas sp. SL4(2022)]|uniref:DUF2846 domain-containing protein n=1 Tax=Pseudomonas sp. SL4(2022) TaxID=2994661 RepID=UPI00226FA5F9|nr:DUF2846 domain-containing protein [Pseudomonas sp. SL4(2022)]WAC43154.1 DUF2846 domain-containing protein [Pseudomonas sp. SL4(2022)]